jgi:hypothetical protein
MLVIWKELSRITYSRLHQAIENLEFINDRLETIVFNARHCYLPPVS